jgi:hypothetical protein
MTKLGFVYVIAAATGCGGHDGPCDPAVPSDCDHGQVCEQVTGSATPACFAPVELHGRVLDLATHAGIAGARVVAVDVNGAAASGVAISAADGTYALQVPVERAAGGVPAAFPVTLRADAAGYQAFPGTIRQPLPIDVATAVMMSGSYVVQSALTDVGLLARTGAAAGALHGHVEVPADHAGVLVVAELAGKGAAAIAARDGDYAIFNLAPGHYTVAAYARGHVYAPAELDVAADTRLDLALSSDPPGSLSGAIDRVDGKAASGTSVIAFVESTFDPLTGRGVPPPGLRAPASGPPSITGAFTIDGVPPGKYVVVAAFENDGLVRDPDHCINGTADVHVQVAGGQTAAAGTFKVTGALAVMSPGAAQADAVTIAPTLTWADDAGEDHYAVEVFDALGQRVWNTTILGVTGGIPAVAYGGPMASGMYYQFRVTSTKTQGTGTTCELSRTEDLRGVFYVP